MSIEENHVQLQVYVGPHVYGTLIVERAAITEVSRPTPPLPSPKDPGTSYFNTNQHCDVVTKHARYLVYGEQAIIARKIWPPDAVCQECKRPL